jgi:hypothetical protein
MTSVQKIVASLPRPLRRRLYRAGYYVDNRAHPGTEVLIISYPKTGRTWLRVLIGRALCDHAGIDDALLLDTPRLTAAARLHITRFTHDDASLNAAIHYTALEADKSRYRSKKVIFLARDPRDTMVSCYFQATRRINQFDGPLSGFIRDERLGIKKYVRFARIWHDNRHLPRDFLVLHYEDMHADACSVLATTLAFIGVESIDEDIVTRAVAYGSFQNMKKLESSGKFQEDRLQPRHAADPESYKVRQGEVGGYAKYLSADDISFIAEVVESMNYPFPTSGSR